MRIGIFGGTFDPAHRGHLRLAEYGTKTRALDKLIWVPALRSPFKEDQEPASFEDRMHMVKLLIGDREGWEVSDIESKREPPSYTYDTVMLLKETEPEAEWFLLVGSDVLSDLGGWHRSNDLRSEVQLLILPRTPMSISSTQLKGLRSNGHPLTKVTTPEVEAYINEKGLYQHE